MKRTPGVFLRGFFFVRASHHCSLLARFNGHPICQPSCTIACLIHGGTVAAIWKGSLAFGLVNIPVELRSAVRADHISFRLLHKDDLSPVKYERVCQADGDPVPWEEIVKGYEYEKGKFVVMSDEDFKAAAIEGSKSIDIIDFVKEEEIDPRYFETPYYLVPAKNAEKSYALLRAREASELCPSFSP
jgi:Ku protein